LPGGRQIDTAKNPPAIGDLSDMFDFAQAGDDHKDGKGH
jgi:hypothetical protein